MLTLWPMTSLRASPIKHRLVNDYGDESSLREVSLAAYLERLSVSTDLLCASVFDLGRAFDVPPYLLSDAVRTIA